MNYLTGKSILFIAPKTFGYERLISDKLAFLGADVTYFDDRPTEKPIVKVLLRLMPRLIKPFVSTYFEDIVSKTKDRHFDYILCIKQECFPKKILEELFRCHQHSKKIFYTWDSFSNSRNALYNKDLFDRCFTFDDEDAKRYELSHRPLFYYDGISNLQGSSSNPKYDISFVGSVHKFRYQFIKNVLKNIPSHLNTYIYMYVPYRFMFYFRKVFMFNYYGASSRNEFEFSPLSKVELSEVFNRSKVILDFSHHHQSGLTMRSIEALGAQKKLVTNNNSIKSYDFYDEQNILVLDQNCFNIPTDFLESDYLTSDKEVYFRYSLEGWIKEILEN